MSDGKHLCLHMKRAGEPEIHYWPGLWALIEGEPMRLDALVRARQGDEIIWILVEIDEDGTVSAESRRRERKVGLPTIRLRGDEIVRRDMMAVFLRRIKALFKKAA